MNIACYFILLIVISLVSPSRCGQVIVDNGSLNSPPVVRHERAGAIRIGAIFDESSRRGREAKVAIEMVVHDFNLAGDQNLQIHYGNSQGKPVRAALAGKFICPV